MFKNMGIFILLSMIAMLFMVGSVSAAGGVRMTVKSIALTQNGYGVALDSYTKYHVSATDCATEKVALEQETSVNVGGKQVFTLNKVTCDEPNQTVNQ